MVRDGRSRVSHVAGGPRAADEDVDQRDQEEGEGGECTWKKYEYGATLTGGATSFKTRLPLRSLLPLHFKIVVSLQLTISTLSALINCVARTAQVE